ncbi:MAG: acyl-ACP--UDP-N-acetylglucosamine O-acyltransferase [Deltaproteobacteria bacterium]|nr:acyl-ACP--UDP-N-acetylglucosamine O-acyltransferase [Deltaproteobacteria bacterium]
MIHPTAIVDRGAEIAESAEIGPYCVVGAEVVIGEGARLRAHVTVEGPTRLGARVEVHPFAALGGPPQDKRYAGEPTRLEIGDDTVVREHVTVHRGTLKGGGVTRIGARTLLMAGVHVAHDAQVGDDCTLAGATLLAGHVILEEGVVTGGAAAFAQFVHVGAMAFVAAGARVEHDVPPFHIAQGDRARVRALNLVGLERRGVPPASRAALQTAHRQLYRSGRPIDTAAAQVDASDPYVQRLLAFVRGHTMIPGPARG